MDSIDRLIDWHCYSQYQYRPQEKDWVKEIFFYYNNPELPPSTDLKTDWRFNKIDGVRAQAEYLGDVTLERKDFPVQFPLKLDNGFIVQDPHKELPLKSPPN